MDIEYYRAVHPSLVECLDVTVGRWHRLYFLNPYSHLRAVVRDWQVVYTGPKAGEAVQATITLSSPRNEII